MVTTTFTGATAFDGSAGRSIATLLFKQTLSVIETTGAGGDKSTTTSWATDLSTLAILFPLTTVTATDGTTIQYATVSTNTASIAAYQSSLAASPTTTSSSLESTQKQTSTSTGPLTTPTKSTSSITTSSSTSATPIPAQKDGVSKGGAAGIAVALFALGVALTAIAFLLLLARKRRNERRLERTNNGEYSGYNDTRNMQMKTPVSATIAIPSDSSSAIVYSQLPQAREDKAITNAYSQLKSKIDGHVQTFYLQGGGNDQAATQALASMVGSGSPIPIDRVGALLKNPRSRLAVLRAALVLIVIQRISPNGDSSFSFLPRDVVSTYNTLSANRIDTRSRSAFFSQWRRMTGVLSHGLYGQEIISQDDLRMENILMAVQQADMFLGPYARRDDPPERLQNLEEIMKRAARFGWLLFSQPSDFAFDWSSGGRGNGIVVFPGLVQVSDDNGRLGRSREFVQKEVALL